MDQKLFLVNPMWFIRVKFWIICSDLTYSWVADHFLNTVSNGFKRAEHGIEHNGIHIWLRRECSNVHQYSFIGSSRWFGFQQWFYHPVRYSGRLHGRLLLWHNGALGHFKFCMFFSSLKHVPIKQYATEHDGIFVQWVMSFGSLMVGFCINMIMGSPPVQLMATGGGVLWTFGWCQTFIKLKCKYSANSIAQFVISGLGLAPALLLWSTTNILTGWSTGRFGLFGLKKKTPEHDLLNVIGLITIIFG